MAVIEQAGDILRGVMEAERWTQEEMAFHAGVSAQTMHRWLTGKVNVDEKRLSQALVNMGRDPAEFNIRAPRGSAPKGGWTADHPMATPPEWWLQWAEQQRQAQEQQNAALRDLADKLDVLIRRR